LLERIAHLEARIRELEAQLNRNASNSSVPPSQNPPQAPKPVTKKPTGRKPGGQPGHPGHRRVRWPPERLTAVVRSVPTHCRSCATPLPAAAGPADPEPTWHQVAELPEALVAVTEHQGQGRRCPGCGAITWAPIPAAVRAHGQGPRLAAAMAYLSGCHHLSKRGVQEVVAGLFGLPVGLGTVTQVEQEMSHALAPAHAAAQQVVQAAPVKHVDETGWKLAGQLCWLWTAATATVACFVIHARRGWDGLAALLGDTVSGILHSDRWSAYNRVAVGQRQLCWAHLKRDFQKCVDRGGPATAIGHDGLAVVDWVFDAWYAFRGGGISRSGLQAELAPIRRELQFVLEAGCGCADPKVATFCRNLLAVYPALWTFSATDGVEPTNNHAERMLRRGVLWRKNAFGCHSEAGCRFVERILTVVQTLRLQQRNVLDFLHQALVAHRAGLPAPQLLPSG
jgi:transposase